MTRWWFAVVFLSACDKETAPPPSGDSDAEDTAAVDSGGLYRDLTGQEGSIAFARWAPSVRDDAELLTAAALFVDSFQGLYNPAACLLIGGMPCLEEAGDEDSVVAVYDLETFDPSTFDVGGTVIAAGTSLLLEAGQTELYFGSPSEWSGAGLTLDGDFAPYDGAADVAWAAELELLSPDPLAPVAVGGGVGLLPLAWTPAASGAMYLAWNGGAMRLADDGGYDLDLAALELQAPFDVRSLALTRAEQIDLDAAGNAVTITTFSAQLLSVEYTDTEGWTELVPGMQVAEDCDGAKELTPVLPGRYWGDVRDAEDDHDLGASNPTTGYPSPGPDLVLPVALTSGQELTVRLRHPQLDASVYLLHEGCQDDDALDGVDDTLGGEWEEFDYTARTDLTVYLVVDAYDEEGAGGFGLELTVTDP